MAKDFYHNCVKTALEKDGWLITHDPYKMEVEDVFYEVDLGAEPLIGAEKQGEKIAIEIKSFIGPSTVNEFHKAVGQFVDYATALEFIEPERILFLAIPEHIHLTFFQKNVIRKSLERIQAKILVYDPYHQIITAWIR
ncbi:MAG: XisH family protein [Saprospirales bacterium]|nr:XisH family protein [Saprospirales bacterium]